MSNEKKPRNPNYVKPPVKQAAKRKVMDMIARRDHSEKELRTKLRDKFADEENGMEAIEEAIAYAKENNWLGDPSTLAYRLADMLHRRNKGIYYINNYLKEKGLPAVESDRTQELEKALAVVKNKYDDDYKFSREDKARVGRLLASRGFDSETVRKIIYEKL
ncbi:MAG: regulatory protein RecX [Bdellovibrio sp.]